MQISTTGITAQDPGPGRRVADLGGSGSAGQIGRLPAAC